MLNHRLVCRLTIVEIQVKKVKNLAENGCRDKAATSMNVFQRKWDAKRQNGLSV